MVTISEFDAMSQAQRAQTIQTLSESSSTDDVNNAQILMIRQRELAGQNTTNPTALNETQAEQVQETQTQNAQVYEGFVVHQEMKNAMTANQNAYAAPVTPAKTGNPVYNALHDIEGNLLVSEPNIVNSPVAPFVSEMVIQPNDFWTNLSIKPLISNPNANELKAPEGYAVQNVRLVTIEMAGPLLDGQTRPTQKAVAYDLVPITKFEDLSLGNKTNIAFQVGLKLFNVYVDKTTPKDSVLNKLAKTEIAYPISLGLGFGAGGISTLENTVYGTAGLIGSVKKSIETRQLQYSPGFEGFNPEWKTPQLAPTVLGGLISAGLGNQDELKQINAMPKVYRSGYILGSAITEVGLTVVESEGTSFIINSVRGAKVFKMVGAKEIESLTGTGKTLSRTSFTEPILVSERIPLKEANKIADFSRYVTPENILLGGREVRVEKYIDDSYRFISQGVNSVKGAKVFTETIGESLTNKPGVSAKFLNTLGLGKNSVKLVSLEEKGLADSIGSFSIETAGLLQKGKAVIYQKGLLTSPEELYPLGKAFSQRTFTTALIEGSIDPQVYLKLVKTVGPEIAREWYPQMGGVPLQILERATAKGTLSAVKVGSNFVGLSIKSANKGLIGSAFAGLNLASNVKTASSQRTGRTVLDFNPILGTTKTPSSQPRLTPKVISYQPTFFEQKSQGKPAINTVFTPSTSVNNKEIVTPFQIPMVNQKESAKVIPALTPFQTTKTTPKTTTSPFLTPFPYPQSRQFNYPFYKPGSSGLGFGGSSNLKGKWRKQDNPVKSWDKMLKTVGIKTSSKTVRSVNKVEKAANNPVFNFKLKNNPFFGSKSKRKRKK